jgi:hypothetical protein
MSITFVGTKIIDFVEVNRVYVRRIDEFLMPTLNSVQRFDHSFQSGRFMPMFARTFPDPIGGSLLQ